jgi:hypothetical protein
MSNPPDRATVVAAAVMQIVARIAGFTRPKKEVRQEIENYLRDEFADAARQSAADVCGPLDEFLDRGEPT